MKFALALNHLSWTRGGSADPVTATITAARLADEAGFESLWLNEDPEGWDAFAVLGALARQTTTIRLGTGVTNPYHRHPNLIAASVATLDRLSEGRAFLGLGRGQPEWYRQALGISAYPPLALLSETFDLLHAWWTAPHRASASGPIEIREWERSIVPKSQPPIYLAAAGPKALDLAGRCADGVLFNELASVDFLATAIDRVRESADQVGRDPSKLAFFVNPAITVTDDPEPILERKKGFIATVYALPGMDRMIASPAFDTVAIMAEVKRAMKIDEILGRGGGFPDVRREGDLRQAKAALPTEFVAELAAVGPLEMVGQRLRQLAMIGATHVFVDRHGLPDELSALADLLQSLQACCPN